MIAANGEGWCAGLSTWTFDSVKFLVSGLGDLSVGVPVSGVVPFGVLGRAFVARSAVYTKELKVGTCGLHVAYMAKPG